MVNAWDGDNWSRLQPYRSGALAVMRRAQGLDSEVSRQGSRTYKLYSGGLSGRKGITTDSSHFGKGG